MSDLLIIANKKAGILALLLLLGGLLVYLGVQERRPSVTLSRDNASPGSPAQSLKPKLEPEKAGPKEEDFFITYRLERERARGKQMEIFRSIVDDPNSTPEAKKEAQRHVLDAASRLEQEMQLENLLKAKGFEEVALIVQPPSAMVIVRSKNLKTEEASRIADLVARTTGIRLEDIVVIPKS